VYNPEYCKRSGRLTVAPNDPKAVFTLFHIRGMDFFTDISMLSFQTLFRAFLKFRLKNKMLEQRFSRYKDEQKNEWPNFHLEMPSWSGDNSTPVCCLTANPASIFPVQ